MADDNVDRQRRSIRLAHYDYSQDGAYFLTLCVRARLSIFGQIVDGVMQLNECGSLVASEWCRTSAIRPQVALDEFVVMPNHFHAIIAMEDSRRGVLPYAHPRFQSPSQSLGSIVRGFKSATTTLINSMRNSPGAPVWHRRGVLTYALQRIFSVPELTKKDHPEKIKLLGWYLHVHKGMNHFPTNRHWIVL